MVNSNIQFNKHISRKAEQLWSNNNQKIEENIVMVSTLMKKEKYTQDLFLKLSEDCNNDPSNSFMHSFRNFLNLEINAKRNAKSWALY